MVEDTRDFSGQFCNYYVVSTVFIFLINSCFEFVSEVVLKWNSILKKIYRNMYKVEIVDVLFKQLYRCLEIIQMSCLVRVQCVQKSESDFLFHESANKGTNRPDLYQNIYPRSYRAQKNGQTSLLLVMSFITLKECSLLQTYPFLHLLTPYLGNHTSPIDVEILSYICNTKTMQCFALYYAFL